MFGERQFEGVHMYSIIQDHALNYWFATNEGVYKHDGYSFELVECDEMLGRSVFGFVINSKGVIYCHNLNQQVFQLKNGIMSLVFELPDKGADLNIVVNQDDQLLISSSENQYLLNSDNVLVYRGVNKTYTRFFYGTPFVSSENVTMMHRIGTNRLFILKNGKTRIERLNWAGEREDTVDLNLSFFELDHQIYAVSTVAKKIYRFDLTNFTLSYERKVEWENPNEAMRFSEVGDKLWASSNAFGLRVLDPKMQDVFQGEKCFQNYLISCIYLDHEGNYLLGTFDNGIVVVPDLKITDRMPLLRDKIVTRLVADGDRVLYMGTQGGEILAYDREISLMGQSVRRVFNLFYWKEPNVLINDLNFASILDCTTKKQIVVNKGSLKAVTQIDKNRVLIGLNIGLIECVYNPENKTYTTSDLQMKGRIYSLDHEQNTGYTYISSVGSVSCRKSDGSIVSLFYKYKLINALSIYSDGNVTYISTSKNGVLCFSKGKFVRQFVPKQMGSNLLITKMVIHNRRLYANTQLGLVIMDLNGGNQLFINRSRGLTVNRVIDFELFRGEIWVTHGKGVQRFDLKSIWANLEEPRLILSSVRVNDKSFSIFKPGKFSADQKRVSFTFRSPTLRNRDYIRYHYKLIGLSNE